MFFKCYAEHICKKIMQNKDVFYTFKIDNLNSCTRLDLFLSFAIQKYSRSFLALLIKKNKILVNRKPVKPGYRLKTDDIVSVFIPPPIEPDYIKPELIDIDILFEDEHLIVVNKHAGLVVHPAPGNHSGTLVNGLLFHCKDLEGIGGVYRPGIVHRLDKDTSGALVIAKSIKAHNSLSMQFKNRIVEKKYLAIVHGQMKHDTGKITKPIGRHPIDRKKMSTVSRKGRNAETVWKVLKRFEDSTLIDVNIKTGRTHQIRVHCFAMNHPVVGDKLYSGKKIKTMKIGNIAKRQMLHAKSIKIFHPHKNNKMFFEAPTPFDMQSVIDKLEKNAASLFDLK